jgi:hypothetical protein
MHELVAYSTSCLPGAGGVSMNADAAPVQREAHFNTESFDCYLTPSVHLKCHALFQDSRFVQLKVCPKKGAMSKIVKLKEYHKKVALNRFLSEFMDCPEAANAGACSKKQRTHSYITISNY